MKASVVEKPNVLNVREIPEVVPGEYDAVCEILFGATCAGTDSSIIEGRFPFGLTYPTVLGHESIGRVIETGPKVKRFKKGDLITRVGWINTSREKLSCNWGGFAQRGIARDHFTMKENGIPAREWGGYTVNQVLPSDFNAAAATMIITWRETLSFMKRMGVSPGSRVLIIGSGGNGLAFAAHAANLGARRVAVIGNIKREKEALSAGGTDYFDYKNEHLTEIMADSGIDKFDFIIDAVGKNGTIDRLWPILAPGGTVSIYGLNEYLKCLFTPQRSRGSFTYYNNGYNEAEAHEAVIDFIKQGRLNAGVWMDIDNPYPLENIKQAYADLSSRQKIKALIKIS